MFKHTKQSVYIDRRLQS